MPAFSVQEIIDRAAAIADVQDNFVSPQTWLDWFNAERKALIISKLRSGWTDNVVQNSSITLPFDDVANLWAILGVWEVSSSGRYRRLRRVDHMTGLSMTGINDTASYWSLAKTNEADPDDIVYLWPAPTTGNYQTWYVPYPDVATDGGDLFQFDLMDDERVVLGMARRALIKEESDTREVDLEIRRFDALVEESSWARSIAEVPAVRNVDAEVRGWESQLILPPFTSWYWV